MTRERMIELEDWALNGMTTFQMIDAICELMPYVRELEVDSQSIRDFVEKCATGYYQLSTVEDVQHDAVVLLSIIDSAKNSE